MTLGVWSISDGARWRVNMGAKSWMTRNEPCEVQTIPGRENSKCKVPGAGESLEEQKESRVSGRRVSWPKSSISPSSCFKLLGDLIHLLITVSPAPRSNPTVDLSFLTKQVESAVCALPAQTFYICNLNFLRTQLKSTGFPLQHQKVLLIISKTTQVAHLKHRSANTQLCWGLPAHSLGRAVHRNVNETRFMG